MRTQQRSLPSTDQVLRAGSIVELIQTIDRKPITRLVREVLEEFRSRIHDGAPAPEFDVVVNQVRSRAEQMWLRCPGPILNATGVVLHTNLGRAPLSDEAQAAVARVSGYSDLELDLKTGERGSRQVHVGHMMRVLTGAEAVHVTVNGASALLLALTVLARRKEVIVSRGQAVEIGGGFRIPEIMKQSGARLVEVGTTNRTRLSDYEESISPRTAALLHVHASNFRIVGFTESVDLEELARLAHRHGILLIDDNGSGALLDTARFGLRHEPMPAESVRAGADIIAFSGDKLLGGPQAGILLGRAPLVSKIGAHSLARAIRPDKTCLAALGATLMAYLRGDAESSLPIWQMILQSDSQILARAIALQTRARSYGLFLEHESGESTIGGGSLPGETLPTTLLILPSKLTAARLRATTAPIVGRTHGGRVLLDLRTVPPQHDEKLLTSLLLAAGIIDGKA
jgi:L-seryl-tRNA(Ser) seleniumtransferase